jgi:hypothetical protein
MAWGRKKYERRDLPMVVEARMKEAFRTLCERVSSYEDTSDERNMGLTYEQSGPKRLMLMFKFIAAPVTTRNVIYAGAGVDIYERLKESELNRARDAVMGFIKDLGFESSKAFVGKGYVSYYIGPDWYHWNRMAQEVRDVQP